MARRFDLGRALLLAGGLLLLVSLFTDWYDTGVSGWQVFEALDLILAALGAAAVALALLPEWLEGWRIAAIPAAVLFIVIVQLIDAPPAAGGGDPAIGIWLALGAGLLLAAGAVLALARISVTVQLDERERRRRMAAVDRRVDPAEPVDEAVVPPPPAGAEELQRTQPLSAIEEDDAPSAENPKAP